MSFPDPRPPFMQSMPPFSGNGDGSDSVGFWSQIPPSNGQFDPHSGNEQHPPFKRLRNSEENQSNPSMNMRGTGPYPPPINKGSNNIFFKTRMCAKFKSGMCRNGENCNFAHGIDDIRQPPPNWQELVSGRDEDRPTGNWEEDQKIIHRMKLCKKFYNGEECPYGDRCNFLHEDPAVYRDDPGRFRESSVISIGTTGSPVVNGCGSNNSDGNRVVSSGGLDASRLNVKPVYWKTKLCTKWELTGQCPFGDKCHFAHGKAELQAHCGWIEGEAANTGSILTKSQLIPAIDASANIIDTVSTSNEEAQGKKYLLKLKISKKINRIYADWLDDQPLLHNMPSKLES